MTLEQNISIAQGRLRELVPIAVIDIGSNSVRQVVYEGLTRAPAMLFNEKILCGLGKGMVTTNTLNQRGVKRSLAAIQRFTRLARQMHVSKTHIIATAAVRDAKNGNEFIKDVESIVGQKVEVLTGKMEARYSAFGIKSGFHNPAGIVGDMGGGSLELVTLGDEVGNGITLPLGGIRLNEMSSGSLSKARKIVRNNLKELNLDWPSKDKTFFAIGGTWRSLGKLHIANTKYPLSAVHDYEVKASEIIAFCNKIINGDLRDIKGIYAVSKNRRDLLPIGAVVMREVLKSTKAKKVSFSSLGIREGVLYSLLSKQQQRRDSLLRAAKDLSVLRARSPEHCVELATWTEEAFKTLGIKESEDDARHRVASCFLADVAWRAHPDFRADQSLGIIANAGFVAISHEGRAYLAIANYHRYQGLGSKIRSPKIASLANPAAAKKARILAALFRVLYMFSATMPNILPRIKLKKVDRKSFVLKVPKDLSDLIGERPKERVKQLERELDRKVTIEVV